MECCLFHVEEVEEFVEVNGPHSFVFHGYVVNRWVGWMFFLRWEPPNLPFCIASDGDIPPIHRNVADWWLKHTGRREHAASSIVSTAFQCVPKFEAPIIEGGRVPHLKKKTQTIGTEEGCHITIFSLSPSPSLDNYCVLILTTLWDLFNFALSATWTAQFVGSPSIGTCQHVSNYAYCTVP